MSQVIKHVNRAIRRCSMEVIHCKFWVTIGVFDPLIKKIIVKILIFPRDFENLKIK